MSTCEKLKEPFTKKYRWQYFSCGSAAAGGLCIGATLGWAGPSIDEILSLGEHGNISNTNASWIASLPLLGSSIGSILGYILNSTIGPRRTIMIFSLLFSISWFLMRFLMDVNVLMASRFASGISTGAFFIIIPNYIKDVAEESLRQKFYTMFIHQVVGGIFFSYIHALMGWKKMTFIGGVIGLQLFISMYFIPDSPKYLFGSGKTEDGIEALKKLRGSQFEEIVPEFHEILKTQNEKLKEPKFSIISLLDSNLFVKKIALSSFFICCQNLTGAYAFILYPLKIFSEGNIYFNPVTSMIIFGVVIVIGGTLFGVLQFNVNPQKKFLIISGVTIQTFLFLSGLIFHQKSEEIINPYILCICKVLFPSVIMFFYYFGFEGTILTLYKHLVENSSLRERGESFLFAIQWLCAFLITKIYLVMIGIMGVSGTFFTFGILSFVGVVGSVCWYPDISISKISILPNESAKIFEKKDELPSNNDTDVEIKKIGDTQL